MPDEKTQGKLMGCVISVLVFAVFFGGGLFSLAGGLSLLIEGLRHFDGGFWWIFETVAGGVIVIFTPIVLLRISLKYKQMRTNKEVDKTA